ncbi:MAG: ribosomal RNA small subunit methyltransferase A [Planctomycetes bacterium]|nr:ribosomal RNA small subunit methyltransferase A [Planctomycetota bacterium]
MTLPRDLRNKSDLKAAFKESQLWTRKELGQNFLIDHNLLRWLVDAGDVDGNDLVLDVGAGTGLLTRQVWAVEVDRRLFDFCSTYTSGLTNVRLLHQDVLRDKFHIDPALQSALQSELAARPGACLKVISNLPYSISTLVIPTLLEGPLPVRLMVLTVQKEVGERLAASPGTKAYGSLSVVVQARANVRILRILHHTVFWPQPSVDSAIVRIEAVPERIGRAVDPAWFGEVARGLFSARRKTAVNALGRNSKLRLQAERVAEALGRLGVDVRERGERLTVEQILDLSNELLKRDRAPVKVEDTP